MNRPGLVFFLVLILMTSCQYLDTDSYNVDITYSYNPEVSITSSLDFVDSVLAGDSVFFKYEIDVDTGMFYYSDLYLDNGQIARFDSKNDSLWIPSYYISEEKEYKVTVAAFYKTYSGSLADVLNAESRVYDTSWKFMVYGEK